MVDGDEHEEGRRVHGPRHGVLAHVHHQLDQHEDGGSEAARDDGRHAQAGEDGARPLPSFHPHCTCDAPTVATPTPATAEMSEYVDDTWAECRVHHMTHDDAAARAQVKASICTPALPRKASLGMMPFLMVSAVRAPTVMAPSISKMVPNTMAWRYEMDRDDTDVAQELATSSARCVS